LRSVTLADLEAWLASARKAPKGRKNVRTSAVTFFRWARKRDYLPDAVTVAEKLEPPKVPRSIPETWSPTEFQTLLNHCPPAYLPWLILAGQAGFRHEELFAEQSSGKSPLDWSDFHWDRSLIIVRPETSKNDERRVVPILPAVRSWLYPRRKESGRVVPSRPPHKTRKLAPAITAALGEHVGGWRQNALRHSFISYRAAQVGLAQTAMEAGNSEKEARRSYHDAMGLDAANEWFSVAPKK
jgi:integrase